MAFQNLFILEAFEILVCLFILSLYFGGFGWENGCAFICYFSDVSCCSRNGVSENMGIFCSKESSIYDVGKQEKIR